MRLNRDNISVLINKKNIKSGHQKLGAFIGSNTKFGINTSIMPGKKIGKNCLIGPNVNIHKNIPNNSSVFQKQPLEISTIN